MITRTYVLGMLLFVWPTICCDQAAPEQNQPQVKPKSFFEQQKASIASMSKEPWYQHLESVDAHDLFSYLSGFYKGGHSFPAIYLDPASREFWVTGRDFRQRYSKDELEKALESYLSLLVAKGYPIPNQDSPQRPHVWINGKKMVLVSAQELFPDSSAAKSHFSEEQWRVLYSELCGWTGFTYLSGIGSKTRDYPLIVGLGFQETARLRVLEKQSAVEFTLDKVDEAFAAYRKLVKARTQ
ncbi:hypothetical protein ACFL2F_04545 [Myxococcota bacterium]